MDPMPDNPTLREATSTDRETLLALEQGVVSAERPFNDAIRDSGARYYDLDKLIADPDTLLLVGEVDGRIIATGYVQLRQSEPAFKHARHAYLGFMYVAERYRGRGINRTVIEALVDWSRRRGVMDVYLDVYVDNASAIRAYEKLGFKGLLLEMKLDPPR
ncbi:GNAT family N-acetyltransferase [Novilysobacter erysipheiresistens]|uniref:GNAT family N-acetyltransferase n=1 Tax=Novilysobacter erysipheiresistens TaxID=1749332 RepID=A0ABU7YU54_9GAMM